MGEINKSTSEVQRDMNEGLDNQPKENSVYNDIQGSSEVGRSNVAPTLRDYNFGIAGGVTFKVAGWDVNDYQDHTVQTSHGVKLSTLMDEHIHFVTPTDATGTKMRWQLDVISAGIEENFAPVVGSPFTFEYDFTEDTSDKHKLTDIAEFAANNTTVSSIVIFKITRIAATSNEYSGEVYVMFTDGHVELDQIGSRAQSTK